MMCVANVYILLLGRRKGESKGPAGGEEGFREWSVWRGVD
jgi:hypothetical protein